MASEREIYLATTRREEIQLPDIVELADRSDVGSIRSLVRFA